MDFGLSSHALLKFQVSNLIKSPERNKKQGWLRNKGYKWSSEESISYLLILIRRGRLSRLESSRPLRSNMILAALRLLKERGITGAHQQHHCSLPRSYKCLFKQYNSQVQEERELELINANPKNVSPIDSRQSFYLEWTWHFWFIIHSIDREIWGEKAKPVLSNTPGLKELHQIWHPYAAVSTTASSLDATFIC